MSKVKKSKDETKVQNWGGGGGGMFRAIEK